jgi:hypothetical protein
MKNNETLTRVLCQATQRTKLPRFGIKGKVEKSLYMIILRQIDFFPKLSWC